MTKLNITDGGALDLLLSRRSTPARQIGTPGPTQEDLEKILRAGMRVPDHGKLTPWRVIVFSGGARNALGDVIASSISNEQPESSSLTIESLRAFPALAPVMLAVISRPDDTPRIPEWEQRLSAGAVCQNMLIAAAAMGYACQWVTGKAAYSQGVAEYLGLQEGDRIAGFLFFGAPAEVDLTDRPRPSPKDVVTYWDG